MNLVSAQEDPREFNRGIRRSTSIFQVVAWLISLTGFCVDGSPHPFSRLHLEITLAFISNSGSNIWTSVSAQMRVEGRSDWEAGSCLVRQMSERKHATPPGPFGQNIFAVLPNSVVLVTQEYALRGGGCFHIFLFSFIVFYVLCCFIHWLLLRRGSLLQGILLPDWR